MNKPSRGIFGRETIAEGGNHVLVKIEGVCGRPEVTSEKVSSGRAAFTLDSAIATETLGMGNQKNSEISP